MKILWVSPLFLHPTTKGGQIRTLEMLRCIHRRHEVHYVGLHDPADLEGPSRANEYSTKSYAIPHRVAPRNSVRFAAQVAAGAFGRVPLAVSRFESDAARHTIRRLLREEGFDRAVCDFLAASPHYPDLPGCVLFQHNVETMIWRRSAEHAADPFRRAFLNLQAKRMFNYEREVCLRAGQVVAVSDVDAGLMRELFGSTRVSAVPTGVNIEYFTPPQESPRRDLVFVGSMDWRPNVDGVLWFVSEVLPRLRVEFPDCRLSVVGRNPPPEVRALAGSNIEVPGTVPDVRPWLWRAAASIVPLRIGGGTRLKIYESMAAKAPVISTTIGAEGLEYTHGENILIGDTAEEFAHCCASVLNGSAPRDIAANAAEMVSSRFSWDSAARRFEAIMENAPAPSRSLA